MTEIPTQTTLQDAERAADGPDRLSEGGDSGERESEPEKPMPREQRYRLELRAAEAQRDALADRVERMQTRELERIAGESISNPADLLKLTGKSVADFIGEDGELDTELVTEAATELLSSRPGLKKNAPAFDPTQGLGGNGQPKPEPSWGALLVGD